MTPKQKAKELVDKYQYYVTEKDFFGDNVELKNAKQCSLIAVDEILEIGWNLPHYNNKSGEEYWHEVKQEIEKL